MCGGATRKESKRAGGGGEVTTRGRGAAGGGKIDREGSIAITASDGEAQRGGATVAFGNASITDDDRGVVLRGGNGRTRRTDLIRIGEGDKGSVCADDTECGEAHIVSPDGVVEGRERCGDRRSSKEDFGLTDVVAVIQHHCITTGAQTSTSAGVAADLQRRRRSRAEPSAAESGERGQGRSRFEEDDGFTRSDAGDASERKRRSGRFGAVVDFPTGDVHRTSAGVGHFKPIGEVVAIAAAPSSNFRDTHCARSGETR